MYGTYVESSLHEAVAKTTDPKKADQQRQQTLHMLLSQDDIPEVLPGGTFNAKDTFVHDADDPVPIELARKLPPAVKFTGRQFADPANIPAFKKNKSE